MAIERDLEDVLGFYGRQGIALGRKPVIKLIDAEISSGNGMVIAGMVGDPRDLGESEKFFQSYLRSVCWRAFYGLEASLEAFEQLFSMRPEYGSHDEWNELARESAGADIILFRPYMLAFPGQQKKILAHEYWHFVDQRVPVLKLMREGTATFAAALFAGETCDRKNVDHSQRNCLYDGGAFAVQTHMEGRPLSDLLTPEMQQNIKHTFEGLFYQAVSKWPKEYDNLIYMTGIAGNYNIFCRLARGVLTEGKLLTAFRELGARQLADEIEGQDMSSLLEKCRKEIQGEWSARKIASREAGKFLRSAAFRELLKET